MLTVDELREALPSGLRNKATQEFCDLINTISNDPEEAREVRENFITYTSILLDGQFRMPDYINAVTYCTFKFMGLTNKAAYKKTFPDRYARMVAQGKADKDIAAFVAIYHRGMLVTKILQQALIPSYILNQDAFQKAINTQVFLMENAYSETVRTAAANSLLVALKQPEVKKIEMELSTKGGGLGELKETLQELVQRQKELMEQGATAKQMGRVPIGNMGRVLEHEVTDVVPVELPAVVSRGTRQMEALVLEKPMPEPPPAQKAEEVLPSGSPKVSLFGLVNETTTGKSAVQGANYAKCCEQGIEECTCENPEHIYLPVKKDVPQTVARKSMFDDPADMP